MKTNKEIEELNNKVLELTNKLAGCMTLESHNFVINKTFQKIVEEIEEVQDYQILLCKYCNHKNKIQKIGEEIINELCKEMIERPDAKESSLDRIPQPYIKEEISKIINNQIQDASNRKKEGEEVNSKVGHPDIPIKAVKGLISALDDVKYGRYEVISSGSDDICENIIKTIEKRKDKQHIGTLVRIHNYCKKILKQKKEKIE